MAHGLNDTIFADSTGAGRAAIMVFRLSGPAVKTTLKTLTGKLPKPRHATLCDLRDADGGIIDNALMLFFPAPHSYTGEDMAELQCHGSRAIKSALTKRLLKIDGLRVAEPGEFSYRAFRHGKLNLVEAEGINDLAMAETEAQRVTALAQWRGDKGSLSEWVITMRTRLIELKAFFETFIDFHEMDIPQDLAEQNLKKLAEWIVAAKKLADDNRAELRHDGVTIAIIGAPNVGKSSLANMLAKREVAIVSATAGTTRDVIELHLDMFGYQVSFYDTAGLRRAKSKVEKLGITKAENLAEIADIRIFMKDIFLEGRDMEKIKIKKLKTDIVLANKADIIHDSDLKKKLSGFLNKEDIAFSTKSELGHEKFFKKLKSSLDQLAGGEVRGITNDRQRGALLKSIQHAELAYLATGVEMSAEELKLAIEPLDILLGNTTPDDMLGVIFKNFCIGK
ncbi:MAG: tRNA uridine-5-carboxymethylaminomethyl(34) synthesis GTPase MnmE [Hydrotalea sp.]|nr:tRNA uridine-5-carboxymethylaminomethyl(34) synthesis GTPase MnmE [Hydrotalea sp.]